jgi:hypothetical protein
MMTAQCAEWWMEGVVMARRRGRGSSGSWGENVYTGSIITNILWSLILLVAEHVHNRIANAGHPVLAKITVVGLVLSPIIIAYGVYRIHPQNPFAPR